MKKNIFLLATILFAVFFHGLYIQPSQAQETAPAKTSFSIEELQDLYLRSVDAYRAKEQQFFIAQKQYEQLITLASLEEVVKQSKEVQTARGKTLLLYFEVLETRLLDIPGLELAIKRDQKTKLQTVSEEIVIYLDQVNTANNKLDFEIINTNFIEKQLSYTSAAYEALALLRIAKIQSNLDQLNTVAFQIFTQTEQTPEKIRGFEELANTVLDVQLLLNTALTDLQKDVLSGDVTESIYIQLIDTLATPYSKLRQAENFVQELRT